MLKRTVMWMYCRALLTKGAVDWMFEHFDLKRL
jgi:hypothetical protein